MLLFSDCLRYSWRSTRLGPTRGYCHHVGLSILMALQPWHRSACRHTDRGLEIDEEYLGTYITLQIRDSTGQLQYSCMYHDVFGFLRTYLTFSIAPFSVLNSSNSSCVGSGGGATVTNSPTQPLSTSTSSSSGGSSESRSGTTSKPAGTTTYAFFLLFKSIAESHAMSSSPASSPTSSKGAASQIQAQMGLAFVLSLIGAVVMM